jgi:hypothetical protein
LGSVAGAWGLIEPKGAGVLDPSGAAPKLNLGAAGVSALVSEIYDPNSGLALLSPFSGVDKGLAAPKLKVALAVSSDFFSLVIDLKEDSGTSLGFSSFAARVVDELVANVKPPPPLLVTGASDELGAGAGDGPPNAKAPPVSALAAGAALPNEKPPPLLAADAGAALKINPPVDKEEDSFDLLSVAVLLVEAPPNVNPEEEIAPPVAGLSPAGAGAEEDPALPGRAVSQEAQAVVSSSLWTSQVTHFHLPLFRSTNKVPQPPAITSVLLCLSHFKQFDSSLGFAAPQAHFHVGSLSVRCFFVECSPLSSSEAAAFSISSSFLFLSFSSFSFWRATAISLSYGDWAYVAKEFVLGVLVDASGSGDRML